MKRIGLYFGLVDKYSRATGGLIIALACMSAGLAAYWPVALGKCYAAISAGAADSFAKSLVSFAVTLLVFELVGFARRVSTDCMLARQERQLRIKSLSKMLRMPVAYHEQVLSGECTARMNQGVAGFSQIIKLLCQDIFPATLTTLSVIIATMCSAPLEFSAVMLSYAVAATVISYFQIQSQKGIRETILGFKIKLDAKITQELQNFEHIRCRNADGKESSRLQRDVKMIEQSETRHHVTMGGYDCSKEILQIVTMVVLLSMCFALGKGGQFDAAMCVTVIMLFQQLAAPIDAVYRCMDEFSSGMVKVSVIGDLFSQEDDFHYLNRNANLQGNHLIAEMCNAVVLSPCGENPISCPDDFSIRENERVLLDGPTGCGKTSTLRALVGYYPYSGSVRIMGKEIDSLSPAQIARAILCVPQTPHFFQGSIKDNLLFGVADNLPDEDLVGALNRAHLWDELKHKDLNPLSFNLAEGAKNLSAGQRQRLSIARIFLHKFKLLILDEVTANLDAATTDVVMDSIEQYAAERRAGIIFISHDPNVRRRKTMSVNVSRPVAARGPVTLPVSNNIEHKKETT